MSNTSPIFNLAMIGYLDLLRTQLGEILIPKAVREELEPVDNLPQMSAALP